MNHIMNNKITILFMVCFLINMLPTIIPISSESVNDTISYTLTIGNYTLEPTSNGTNIYIDDFGRLLVIGKPNIPSKILSFAISPQATILSIDIISEKSELLNGTYFINPCQIPDIIGDSVNQTNQQDIFDDNYNEVYTNNDPYPATVGEFLQSSHYRKYNMVDIRINPIQYFPQSEEIIFYSEITVNITYELNNEPLNEPDDNLQETEQMAKDIIYNYDQAQQWYPQSERLLSGLYDYIIITIDSLTDNINSLVNWESAKGRNVHVVTISWINSQYDGVDIQEKIRNFLRDKYPSDQWGIQDVLLIGNYNDVPMRRCAQNMGYGNPETDFYYAELSLPDDESWDLDQDHLYGEDTDTIDFYAEVNVGRFPSSDPELVSHMCNKSVLFENTYDDSYKKNILLLAAFFWPDTDNAELMEQIAVQPWMTNWTITRCYEEAQSSYTCDYDLSYATVESIWSSGTFAFVNWAGHGSPTACYEYYPSTAFVDTGTTQSLNDQYPAIIFADACSNQDTDEYNIGQAMMEQGAVGFLGATKVAYGNHGWDHPYDGSGQSFDYFFTTAVTSGNYTTGKAHQYALTEMYTYGLWYYQAYETFEWGAYLGNPNLAMNVPGILNMSRTSHNFGLMEVNQTDTTSFNLWNDGGGTIFYTIADNCSWLSADPSSGNVSVEQDTITVEINTTGLDYGAYHNTLYINSNAGTATFEVFVSIPNGTERIDVYQADHDRGFPIRHAADGDWAGGQSFQASNDVITRVKLFLRKFGTPEFDLFVELHEDSIDGNLLDTKTFSSANVSSSWTWVNIDFTDIEVDSSTTDYFIVIPPAPSGVTTSFGYEWGYAFGNQYDYGSFWFTRDSGTLWRDLPDMYEFTFQSYGYDLT